MQHEQELEIKDKTKFGLDQALNHNSSPQHGAIKTTRRVPPTSQDWAKWFQLQLRKQVIIVLLRRSL